MLLLTAAVAGCGDTVSLDPVAKAADASSKQASEHMSMTATTTVAGQVISMTGEGDFRNSPVLGSMTMIVPGGGTVTAVQKGSTMYMTSDALRGQLPGGKSWMKMDIDKIRKTLGVSSPSLSSQQSPTDMLAAIRAAGDKVTKDGPDTVDGRALTHYTATVDPARVASLNKALGTSVGATVVYQPIDVWVDSAGLVYRMHMGYSMTGATLSSGVTLPTTAIDMTMTLSKYGEDVNVSVPPSFATYDATKLASSMFKS